MQKDKIIGITFGSFDLCHYGHVLMFEECKQHCDYLIVGVQSDPSIAVSYTHLTLPTILLV